MNNTISLYMYRHGNHYMYVYSVYLMLMLRIIEKLIKILEWISTKDVISSSMCPFKVIYYIILNTLYNEDI